MGYNNPPLKINRPTKFPVPFDKMYSEWNCYLKGSRFMFCWGMITQHGSWTTTCLSPFSCNNSRNSFNKYWLMFFGEKLLYEFVFYVFLTFMTVFTCRLRKWTNYCCVILQTFFFFLSFSTFVCLIKFVSGCQLALSLSITSLLWTICPFFPFKRIIFCSTSCDDTFLNKYSLVSNQKYLYIYISQMQIQNIKNY